MNWLDYTLIAAYLLGLLLMGFVLREQPSRQAFFLGGRQIGWKPLTLSVMATQLSAVSFVSAPAFVGLREGGGLVWLSYELALPIAMLLLLWRHLPTLHQQGVVSVYEYLEDRFDQTSRLLISLVFQISRSFATAIMIYTVSIILQGSMGLAFWQSLSVIGVITVAYSLMGGMKAVVYGDALQMLLIIAGALLCLTFALVEIGGIGALFEAVDPARLETLNITGLGLNGADFGLLPMLFGGVVLYASYYGCDQSEAQRALSAHSQTDLRKMICAAALLRFPITLIYCMAGLAIGTLFLQSPDMLAKVPEQHPDWMMPLFIIHYLPNGLIGLLLVAILAAAMSSLSSAINSLSAVTLEDFRRHSGIHLDDSRYMQMARWTGLGWGVVTLTLASVVADIAPTVIEAINKVGSLFYGPVLATFVLGMTAPRVTAIHANLGLASGLLCNLSLWLFAPSVFWFWWNVSGFISTCLVALLSTRLCLRAPVSGNGRVATLLSKPVALLLLGWFIAITAITAVLPML